jgi:hypothetical protein
MCANTVHSQTPRTQVWKSEIKLSRWVMFTYVRPYTAGGFYREALPLLLVLLAWLNQWSWAGDTQKDEKILVWIPQWNRLEENESIILNMVLDIVTDFAILQIDGASIPRQRLGKRLLTLLCNSWLRIPTFPTQRKYKPIAMQYFHDNGYCWVLCCCGNHEWIVKTSYKFDETSVSDQLAFEEGRHQQTAPTRHQGVRNECKGMIVIPISLAGNALQCTEYDTVNVLTV